VPAFRLQVRAFLILLATRLLLGRRGTTATLRSLTRRRFTHEEVPTQAALRAVQRAAKVLGGACLAQSVALTAMLEQAGQHPTLVLGCRPQGAQPWTAHAWVVVRKEMLEPVRGQAHAELARLEATSGWIPSEPESAG